MDRREALGTFVGVGVGACSGRAGAEEHGADRPGHAPAAGGGPLPPVANIHLHFCGIHVAKANAKFQIVTQHYCAPVGDEMHQCLLYDSREKNARLLGVEYIISNRLYQKLPDGEKKYWHPHTYEVLGGGLIAPEMAPADEDKFMTGLLTTWGKTWHTWPDPTTAVPLGEPTLMWSLTGDGQGDPKVIAARDKEFNVSTPKIREKRAKLIGYEVPQVPFPRSADEVGRQWTGSGDDRPTKR